MDKGFHDAIKAYLEKQASEDKAFQQKYVERMMSDKNSIIQCCSYIIKQVRESKRTAYTDAEIYGMALHFFDEGLTYDGKAPAVRVVSPGDELTEERMVAKKPERKQKPKPSVDDAQLSLF